MNLREFYLSHFLPLRLAGRSRPATIDAYENVTRVWSREMDGLPIESIGGSPVLLEELCARFISFRLTSSVTVPLEAIRWSW